MAELVLYGYWRSSSSHRVRIALALKGLPFTYVAVDLSRREQSKGAYLAQSPTGFVPCLVIDGVAHVESVAIVELLEERFPAPRIYPADVGQRARVRALVEIVNSGIQPFQNLHVLRHVSDDPARQKQWAAHFNERGLAAFERAMETDAREGVHGPYVYGDIVTAADAFLVPQVYASMRFGVDLSPFPRIRGAFEAAERLEAFKQSAPDRQPDAPNS
jgi:maleylpyruvate isomerase